MITQEILNLIEETNTLKKIWHNKGKIAAGLGTLGTGAYLVRNDYDQYKIDNKLDPNKIEIRSYLVNRVIPKSKEALKAIKDTTNDIID